MNLIEEYREIHRQQPAYGTGPGKESLAMLKVLLPAGAKRVLDYGCGNSTALDMIWPGEGVERVYYDPALPGRAAEPIGAFDAGLCTDVLEHIPESHVPAFLNTLAAFAPAWGFIIHTGPAGQKLSDGTNAHVTQRRIHWWLRLLHMRWNEPVAVVRINRWRFLVVHDRDKFGVPCPLLELVAGLATLAKKHLRV